MDLSASRSYTPHSETLLTQCYLKITLTIVNFQDLPVYSLLYFPSPLKPVLMKPREVRSLIQAHTACAWQYHTSLPGLGASSPNSHLTLPLLSQCLQPRWLHLRTSAPSSSWGISALESERSASFKLTLAFLLSPTWPSSFLSLGELAQKSIFFARSVAAQRVKNVCLYV